MSVATVSAEIRIGLEMAQKLLGHTELATTSRYAHVTNDDLRAAMEATTPTQIPTAGGEDKAKVVK